MRNEGRDINPELAIPHVVHSGLHQDYDLDFQMRRVDDIAPTLTSPLLSGIISNICLLGRPEVPREPVSSKAEEGLWGHSGAPARPGAPGPPRNGGLVPHMQMGKMEATESKPCDQGEIDLDQTLLRPDPEEVAAVVILDDDEADLPIDMPQAASKPKVNQPGTRSDPWMTGVHAHPLQRSGQQKKRRGACLPVKQFYPEG